MVYEYSSYRSFLKQVLVQRKKKNLRYSLRAMAKQIRLTPAGLSQVMNGRKHLSVETAYRIAESLGLDDTQTEYFTTLVESEKTKSLEHKDVLLRKIRALYPQAEVTCLEADSFKLIADWYHFAILRLTELEKFEPSSKWISKSLGITTEEADLAVERLLRLGLLKKNGKTVTKPNANPRAVSNMPNDALRSFHRQTLLKAMESLQEQLPSEKFIGSETIAIDKSTLSELERESEKFFNRVLAIAAKGKKKNHVYHVGVQIFKLTTGGG